ncbi:hypothetical protein LCGC14_2475920, partial [marine sediment metagenome]
VPAFIKKYDTEGNLSAIETTRHGIAFGYQMQDIQEIGKTIFNEKSLSGDEKKTIILPFVQAVLNQFNDMNILMTN